MYGAYNVQISSRALVSRMLLPSKNRLARNIHILQVFFLQDLQDLASLALKMNLSLQNIKLLARILQEKIVR